MSTRRAVTHAHAQPAGAGGPSGDSQLGGRRGRRGCPCPATRAPRAWAPAAHWPQVAPVLASPSRVPSCGGPAPGIPSPRATCAHAPCSGSAFREGLGRQCLQTPAPLEKGRRARGGSCRCQRSHADASAWYLASAAQTGVCSLQPCHHGAQKRLTRGLWDNAARREGRSRGGPSPCGSTRSPGGPSRAPRVPVPWPLAPPGGVFRSRRSPAAQPHPAPARGRGFRARFSRCFVSPETSSEFGSLGHESMPPLRLE